MVGYYVGVKWFFALLIGIGKELFGLCICFSFGITFLLLMYDWDWPF